MSDGSTIAIVLLLIVLGLVVQSLWLQHIIAKGVAQGIRRYMETVSGRYGSKGEIAATQDDYRKMVLWTKTIDAEARDHS